MTMVVTIHQPDFLPWLGFFHRLAQSDRYIVLDDVQFIRRGWQNRDRIKTAHGPRWLTVPVRSKGRYTQTLAEVACDETDDWRSRHLAVIRESYAGQPGFARVFPELERVYAMRQNRIVDCNLALLRLFAGLLGLSTPMILASTYDVRTTKTARLVELTRLAGGTTYLTGSGSRDYLDEAAFAAAGLDVRWQSFAAPIYPQPHGPFEANLSILDFCLCLDPADYARYAPWLDQAHQR